jgi:hypothetical protein
MQMKTMRTFVKEKLKHFDFLGGDGLRRIEQGVIPTLNSSKGRGGKQQSSDSE